MTTIPAAVQAYIYAIKYPSEANIAALEPCLAEDVVVVGLVGAATGREPALSAIATPEATRLVATADWSDARQDGGEFVIDAKLPPGRPLAAMTFGFRQDESGRITRIGQQMVLASPPASEPLAIRPEWKELIDGALTNGTPVIVAYVDAAGVPHVSPRGSVHVLNETQLGMWARDPEGGLLKGIASNPNVTFFYRDPKTRAAITITGRARLAADQAEKETVYNGQPALERNMDGRMAGSAVVVDVDLLEAAGPSGRAKMVRA
jgi:hypothetical protein